MHGQKHQVGGYSSSEEVSVLGLRCYIMTILQKMGGSCWYILKGLTQDYTERQAINDSFKELNISQKNLAPHLGNTLALHSHRSFNQSIYFVECLLLSVALGGGKGSIPFYRPGSQRLQDSVVGRVFYYNSPCSESLPDTSIRKAELLLQVRSVFCRTL